MSSDSTQWLDAEENGWKRVTLPHMVTDDNFVSGDPDDRRLRVRYVLNRESGQLRGKVWFGPGTQGPPGHAHGGSMAAVLDEAMGGAAWMAGHMVVAAEITISYCEMLPLETRCVVDPRVVAVDGKKVHLEADIKDLNGRVYATGRGLFIALGASKLGELAGGVKAFIGEASFPPQAGSQPGAMEIDPGTCLRPTEFIDAQHPAIVECLTSLEVAQLPLPQRAQRLFEYVRDEVRYEFMAKLDKEAYVASRVLADKKGFCVQKAILLCALGRAADIPTALVLSDLRDHTLPERIASAIGTNMMHHHGLNAFHLNGRWVKVDASLSADLVTKKGYRMVDFDGASDALQAATTREGEPHAEYVRFHGLYSDLPLEQMMKAFMHAYARADVAALSEMGLMP